MSNGKNEKIKIDNVSIRANELYFIIKKPKRVMTKSPVINKLFITTAAPYASFLLYAMSHAYYVRVHEYLITCLCACVF